MVGDVLGVKVVGGLPAQAERAVPHGGCVHIEGHGVVQRRLVALVIAFYQVRQSGGDGVVLPGGHADVPHIRHGEGVGLHHRQIGFHHSGQLFPREPAVQVFHRRVQLGAEAFGFQRPLEQHVAPVVAHPLLPAGRVHIALQLPLGLHHGSVMVPGNDVPLVPVQRAVQVKVAALGVRIAQQNFKGHPVGEVFPVEPFVQQPVGGQRQVVHRLQQLDEPGVVLLALGLQPVVHGGAVKGGVAGGLDDVLIAVKLKVIDFV